MFVKTENLRGKSVAFLPELVQDRSGAAGGSRRSYGISAYWHEISNSKHVVAFGAVHFSIPSELGNLDYEGLLKVADNDFLAGYDVSFMSGHKIGNPKPWHRDIMFTPNSQYQAYLRVEDYDEAIMQQMRANPGWMPPHADGWYKLRPGKAV